MPGQLGWVITCCNQVLPELNRTGIHNFHLIINGVYPEDKASTGKFKLIADNQNAYIQKLKEVISDIYVKKLKIV